MSKPEDNLYDLEFNRFGYDGKFNGTGIDIWARWHDDSPYMIYAVRGQLYSIADLDAFCEMHGVLLPNGRLPENPNAEILKIVSYDLKRRMWAVKGLDEKIRLVQCKKELVPVRWEP